MRKAEFPERSCREHVYGELTADVCDVRENHRGPCAAYGVPESVQAREAWEKAHPEYAEATKDGPDLLS